MTSGTLVLGPLNGMSDVLRRSMLLQWAPRGFLSASLLLAVTFPHLSYFSNPGNQFELVPVLIYALIGRSLTVLVGWAGQISMGHFAIVGIAAFLTARWAGHADWNIVSRRSGVGELSSSGAHNPHRRSPDRTRCQCAPSRRKRGPECRSAVLDPGSRDHRSVVRHARPG